MISKELRDILCCPETKQDIEYIEGEIIKKINKEIEKKALKNRAGQVIKEPIDAGFLRKDREYLYPVRDDIPIMLIDESIPFEQFL